MTNRKHIVHADTPEGRLAREAILEAVKNQLRENDPPETGLTLARLIKNGESKENAMRLIACAVTVELFEVLQGSGSFDETRYVENLRRLPELPFEESEGN